ncbi:MAG: hypothetical protein F6K14_20425 [Symploca sp. SIO2C1]|nr:hypothetical protein [Symploca sp. SIO2C1]
MGTQTTRRIAIQPSPIVFNPPHTEGDTDFDGNGPNINIETRLERAGSVLNITLRATFRETKSDWTTFAGQITQRVFDVETEHPGWDIQSVHSQFVDTLNVTDFDHNINSYPRQGLVSLYEIQGDTDGGVFGGDDQPWVQVFFNPFELTLVRKVEQLQA